MSERQSPEGGSEPVSSGRRHYAALDGLRCVAIAGVVWHHSLPGPVSGWLGRGHTGVPLFFALSGFLITRLVLEERRLTGNIALGPFWMRRCLRIFPLYYLTLAGFVLFLGLREPNDATRHFFDNLPFYASYTSNWFVDFDSAHPIWFAFAWSLATEEQFYVWWPLLLRYSERLGRAGAPLGLCAVLGLDQVAELGVLAPWLTPAAAPARIATSASAAMLLGALLAWALAQRRGFGLLSRALAARHATAFCAGACALWIWQPIGPGILLDLGFAALVGSAASSRGHGLLRLLEARPLVSIGRVSYGMYLFHVPVLGSLERAFPWLIERPLALFPLAFSLTVIVASLSYRTLEAPLLALRERFRPSPQLAADAAPGWVREA